MEASFLFLDITGHATLRGLKEICSSFESNLRRAGFSCETGFINWSVHYWLARLTLANLKRCPCSGLLSTDSVRGL